MNFEKENFFIKIQNFYCAKLLPTSNSAIVIGRFKYIVIIQGYHISKINPITSTRGLLLLK